jgi:hypothetical protein
MITDRLRNEIQQRAQSAESERQIGSIIFRTLSDCGIDWQMVDRDGMKQLVVDAVRAYRNAHLQAAGERSRQDRGAHGRHHGPRAHHVAV